MLLEKIDLFIPILREKILNFYQERLISLALFGSVARKKFNENSDIDILIICENFPPGRFLRVSEFVNIEKKLESYLKSLELEKMFISPIFKTKEEALKGSPLFLDMIDDCLILYDNNDFFLNILKNLKDNLEKLGAKRIWNGNSWHWKLKSDYKFGEVFKIL